MQWLSGLSDARAVAKIAIRIDRVALGNFGDTAPVGEGVSELRVDLALVTECILFSPASLL